MGIVETHEALAQARSGGLDLVEVAPQARPPVCRIMDYGKWKYAQKKKDRKAKAHRHETELKEIRIRTPKIGRHDLAIKVDRARDFLDRGDRVQFTLRFRGREMMHQDLGRRLLDSVKETLSDVAKIERNFRREGRAISIVLAPISKPKPAPKAAPAAAGPGDSAPETPAPAPAPGPAPAAAPPGASAPQAPAPPPASGT